MLFALPAVAGCTAGNNSERKGEVDVGEAWAVHDDLSEHFELTVYPSIVVDRGVDQDSALAVEHRAVLMNTSEETFSNLTVSFVFDPRLDDYFAAGVSPLAPTPIDVYPQSAPEVESGSAAWGVDWDVDHLLRDAELLTEMGHDIRDVPELAENLTLQVTWDGGEELLEYTAPVLDPDGLLGS